ncbi:hypothetical protein Tco_0718495, partial [Tanacetum coccineum]
MDASRHIRVEGLGEGKKGVSNINKEFYDKEPENGGVFMFKGRDLKESVPLKPGLTPHEHQSKRQDWLQC